MKVLKLLGLILLLGVALNELAWAKAPAPRAAQSRGKCNCHKPKKGRPANSGNLIASVTPVVSSQPRCTGNGIKLWFKRHGEKALLGEYRYLDASSTILRYCDGNSLHTEYLTSIAEIHLNTPPPPSPPPPPLRVLITYFPQPVDPLAGQSRYVTEKVLLSVLFNANGTIGDIEVKQSPSSLLADSAKEAARQIKFTPAQENGRPVSVRQEVTYEFPPRQGPKPRVTLLKPAMGTTFNNNPRLVRFEWTPINNVSYYLLEVEYASTTSPDWYPLRRVIEVKTYHELIFNGPYPGHWRVTPVLPDGTEGTPTEWSRFGFAK